MPQKKGRNQKSMNPKKVRKQGGGKPQQLPSMQSIENILFASNVKNTASNVSTAESIGGGYYAMYKEATLRFHSWMAKEACPDSKMTAVDDLRRAMQQILERNTNAYLKQHFEDLIVAPPEIMTSLASSIRLREKMTAKLFGSKDGGDLGHRYIIDVLKYCRSGLCFANRVAAAVIKAKDDVYDDDDVQKAVGGRFDALSLDDDGSDLEGELDWEDMERNIQEGNLPKYAGVEVEEEIDIKEALLKGDDRFQAIAFLHTMNDLMGIIHKHYGELKAFMRGNAQSAGCIQLVMECAIVANIATESVNRAEIELSLEHPHLSSFYHVLALVFLTEEIAEITECIDEKKLTKSPHMALHFVADILKCVFRRFSGNEEILSVVEDFVRESGLELAYVNKAANEICMLDAVLLLENEKGGGEPLTASRDGAAKMEAWFRHGGYVRAEHRCILDTQKMIELLMIAYHARVNQYRKTQESKGPSFDESNSPAPPKGDNVDDGDLDDVDLDNVDVDNRFVTGMFANLLVICKNTFVEELSVAPQLMTVINLFQRHVSGKPTKPVPIALSFGLLAVLVSIFVLQGDGDLARIAANTHQSYDMLLKQMQTILESHNDSPEFYDLVGGCCGVLQQLIPRVDCLEDKLAIWNPLIGGEYMLCVAYTCSITVGCMTADSLGQLRLALHLLNALKLREPTLDVPFLQNMDRVFKDNKSVWGGGGMPQKGSCCKAYCMSWGMNALSADRLVSKLAASEELISVDCLLLPDASGRSRKRKGGIRPETLSASYRRLVQHDFGSDDLKNRVSTQSENACEGSAAAAKNKGSLVDLLTRFNAIRDAMDEDKDLVLPVNFPAVGAILLEFVNALSVHMGWSSMIQDPVQNDRTFRSNVASLNVKHYYLINIWTGLLSCIDRDSDEMLVDTVSAFTKSFFDKVEKKRYIFFVEDEHDSTSNQSE